MIYTMCLVAGIKHVVIAVMLAFGTMLSAELQEPVSIMIDPGHGGEDVGAMGPKEIGKNGVKAPARLYEKKIVLELAKLLGEQLKSNGYRVSYTRTADTSVSLADRAKIANDEGADLFVSLHLNAFTSKNAKGSEVYFLSLGPVDKDLQDLAEAENETGRDDSDVNSEADFVAGILNDLAQNAYLHESERLAVFIQTELNRLAGIKERGVKQAPFSVLRLAAMPAVLVETAFISNPVEAMKLRNPAFLRSAALAIAKGIQRYIEYSGNNRTRRNTESYSLPETASSKPR